MSTAATQLRTRGKAASARRLNGQSVRWPATVFLWVCVTVGAFPPSPVPPRPRRPDLAGRIARLKAGRAQVVFPERAACPMPSSRDTARACSYFLAIPRTGTERQVADPGRIAYTYDKRNRVLTMSADITGQTTSYEYGDRGELLTLTVFDGRTSREFAFEYDTLGRRTRLTRPNAVVTDTAYDPSGRVAAIVHRLGETVLEKAEYAYNLLGYPETITDAAGQHTFAYDAAGQLLSATHPDQPDETFTYDPVGNRIGDGRQMNAANQLVEDSAYTYEYDGNGALLRRSSKTGGGDTTFVRDALRRVTRITLPSGRQIDYAYRPDNARLSRATPEGTEHFIYDAEDIIAITDSLGVLTTAFTHGPGTDEPLDVQTADGKVHYHLADRLGTIQAVVDENGDVVERYGYSVFGQTTIMDAGGVEITQSALGNIYGYTAREIEEPGMPYYYRNRFYEPSTGRFFSEDPQGLTDRGDTNLYRYVGNMPTAFADPYGLEAESPCELKKKDFVKDKDGRAIGKVLIVKGDVKASDGVIITGAKSFVKMALADGTILSIGPKSTFRITRFHKVKANWLQRLEGTVRKHVLDKARDQKEFYIKTKSASNGVRG